MSALAWIMIILFAAFLVWGLIQAAIERFLTVDETTLSVFKLMIKHRGLDPSKIPDAALLDLVVTKIGEAKNKAAAADAKSGASTDWQRYLFRLLDTDADLIEKIIRVGSGKHGGSGTADILLKYGVVEPDYPPSLSVEHFMEASDRGTLFAELDDRIVKRELSRAAPR
jgi:hypothetical protein